MGTWEAETEGLVKRREAGSMRKSREKNTYVWGQCFSSLHPTGQSHPLCLLPVASLKPRLCWQERQFLNSFLVPPLTPWLLLSVFSAFQEHWLAPYRKLGEIPVVVNIVFRSSRFYYFLCKVYKLLKCRNPVLASICFLITWQSGHIRCGESMVDTWINDLKKRLQSQLFKNLWDKNLSFTSFKLSLYYSKNFCWGIWRCPINNICIVLNYWINKNQESGNQSATFILLMSHILRYQLRSENQLLTPCPLGSIVEWAHQKVSWSLKDRHPSPE